ncbi:28063_t:CDS:1, partial [Gigaspora margarita]
MHQYKTKGIIIYKQELTIKQSTNDEVKPVIPTSNNGSDNDNNTNS